ncbi:ergothioneine biosynthesis PLP-dependent enzyme EgtE [Mycolicibacterium palauense]|uniref:ergothioneine biosynthesis PLP-dependent enzyme EgtE n=1 Tax=Mycolicibacterium palauense TaxID=2034511 RepID=UPI000BFEAE0D|nr:ergothioneine biosynthesis PLP-dependent enzyme EgtE [Mycolicibacterium palauense]
MTDDDLSVAWRAARPPVAGVHLDSAACSRQGNAAIDAAAAHARHEAEVGGYVAAEAAAPALNAGRAAVAALTALAPGEVVFTTGSGHALDLLLGSWPAERSLACVPGEFGPNLATMAAHGFRVHALPVDELGRVRTAELAAFLQRDRPALVHLTGVASHRGVAQPVAETAEVCRAAGVPMVLDAAQALGQIDCAVGADAVYSSSRKWMAGPRGVGFLAVRDTLAQRLVRRIPPADWDVPFGVLASFEHVEANLAARVGYSVALGEYVAAGPERMRARLSMIGAATRSRLDGVAGWRVCEPADAPTAITTLSPPPGVDPARVRSWLIAERRIVTTVAEVARAPFELTAPVLRVAPHVDVTAADLDALADALAGALAEAPLGDN